MYTISGPSFLFTLCFSCIVLCRGVFGEEDEIELSVWDRDRMSANDFLGQAIIQMKEFATVSAVGVCMGLCKHLTGGNSGIRILRIIMMMIFFINPNYQEHSKSFNLQPRPNSKDEGVKGSIDIKLIVKEKQNTKKDIKKEDPGLRRRAGTRFSTFFLSY